MMEWWFLYIIGRVNVYVDVYSRFVYLFTLDCYTFDCVNRYFFFMLIDLRAI
jgi:hypothetical protein